MGLVFERSNLINLERKLLPIEIYALAPGSVTFKLNPMASPEVVLKPRDVCSKALLVNEAPTVPPVPADESQN